MDGSSFFVVHEAIRQGHGMRHTFVAGPDLVAVRAIREANRHVEVEALGWRFGSRLVLRQFGMQQDGVVVAGAHDD
ncbi:hypothetical protein [Janthinobacterium lividum]|uniref:hypothetical protein n=1 Tax=Janthinobacterium lividum TaxID=29581 RepID=UPI0027DA2943|nr:hypothetical protein [Janthinobacterium lividum]